MLAAVDIVDVRLGLETLHVIHQPERLLDIWQRAYSGRSRHAPFFYLRYAGRDLWINARQVAYLRWQEKAR